MVFFTLLYHHSIVDAISAVTLFGIYLLSYWVGNTYIWPPTALNSDQSQSGTIAVNSKKKEALQK